jgi:hypothetical protein
MDRTLKVGSTANRVTPMRVLSFSLTAAVVLLASATATQAAGHSAATNCASFRVVKVPGDVVLSNKVTQLRTTAVGCRTAHAVAKQVATDLLLSKHVPARINGFLIKVVKPCAGCTPRWRVSASGTAGSFKFVILGGA